MIATKLALFLEKNSRPTLESTMLAQTACKALFVALFIYSSSIARADEPVAAGQPASALPNVNQLTDAEKADGWILLFDGKTTERLAHFKKQEISKGWKVTDGALCRMDSSAGDIVSDGEYDNFVLELDYKVPHHANSGVMCRVSEDKSRFGRPALSIRYSTIPTRRLTRKRPVGHTGYISLPRTRRPANLWTPRSRLASGIM